MSFYCSRLVSEIDYSMQSTVLPTVLIWTSSKIRYANRYMRHVVTGVYIRFETLFSDNNATANKNT